MKKHEKAQKSMKSKIWVFLMLYWAPISQCEVSLDIPGNYAVIFCAITLPAQVSWWISGSW